MSGARKFSVVAVVAVTVVVTAAVGVTTLRPRRVPVRPQEPAPEPAHEPDARSLISLHCGRCHSGPKARGAADLASADDADRALWKRTWRQLETGAMPPPGKPQPSADDRAGMIAWIESRLAGHRPRDPGRVVARRLNRADYRNTVRDLVGVDYAPADDFPGDEIGHGFDTVGDALALPPLLLEKYFEAAGRILDEAIVTPERSESRTRWVRGADLEGPGQRGRGEFLLYSDGEAATEVLLPLDADYAVRVRAAGDQAGDEPVRMAIRVDGDSAAVVNVPQPRGQGRSFEARVRLRAGRHRIGAAFLNDFYQPGHPNPSHRDRNLIVYGIEVVGPLDVRPPESHRRVLPVVPSDTLPPREAARAVLARFAERAFRRPVAPSETEAHLALFDRGVEAGDSWEQALKLPLRAVLVSPHFLFRVEPDLPGADPRGVRPLTGGELAVRLSYFLWSSMPDDALREAARSGELSTPEGLERAVRRLLLDARAGAFAENFASQWLAVRRLAQAAPDPGLFPAFDEELREAMLLEPLLVFEAVARENRSILELVDTDFTFLNERLARHYGVAGVRGPRMRRVRLADGRRGGVITMGAVLASTSTATRTSPPKRGKWILETLLNAPPPPPVPDAPSLGEGADLTGLSGRARFEKHREDPRCASCHAVMDPLGFGLENYDATGAWRDAEDGRPIDAAAALPDGSAFRGPEDLKRVLLARREAFARAFVEKLLVYALGRGLEWYDGAAVREIVRATAAGGWRLSDLVLAVARSYPFQHRRASSGALEEDE